MSSESIQIGMLEPAFDATYAIVSSENTEHPHQNLFKGSGLWWESASAVTESSVTFDFGYGTTKSIDYAAFRGVDLLLGQNLTEAAVALYVEGSDDNFETVGAIFSDTDVISGDLVGPEASDYLFTQSSASTGYRYLRFRIVTSASIVHTLRGFGLGTLFVFGGKSPLPSYSAGFSSISRGFESDSGAIFKTSMGKRRREYAFTWPGITDSVRNTFEDNHSRWFHDFPVFLYGPSGLTVDPLGGRRLIFGWIVEAIADMGESNLAHKLTIKFMEDVA